MLQCDIRRKFSVGVVAKQLLCYIKGAVLGCVCACLCARVLVCVFRRNGGWTTWLIPIDIKIMWTKLACSIEPDSHIIYLHIHTRFHKLQWTYIRAKSHIVLWFRTATLKQCNECFTTKSKPLDHIKLILKYLTCHSAILLNTTVICSVIVLERSWFSDHFLSGCFISD